MDNDRTDLEHLDLADAGSREAAWQMASMLDGECIDDPFDMNAACEDHEGSFRPGD